MPTAAELISQGYGGYAGWRDAEAAADFAATGGAGKKTQPSGQQTSTPQTSEQVTPYLNNFQNSLLSKTQDVALQNLLGTYAPNLAGTLPAGGGAAQPDTYVVPEKYAGMTLSDIHNQLLNEGLGTGFGSTGTLASFLGIGEKDKLQAGQEFNLQGWNKDYIGTSSEWKGFTTAFQKKQPAAPTTTTGAPAATTTGAPQPISRVEEFERLRGQYGVADLESFLVDLKSQQEFLYAEMRARTGAERGKPVPMGVISGRVSEIERQQAERIDVVRRLIQTTTDQLNVAYGVISTYINYLGQDYQDAVDSYNNEFQRNLSIYNAISSARGQELEEAKFSYQMQSDQQSIASANLQTMMNAIISGNVNYNDLPMETKATISKLEAQAGLPAGFSSSLKVNPKDSVLFQTSNEGITQVGFIQPDGTVRVEKYGTRISSGGSDKLGTEDYKDYLISDVQDYKNLGQVLKLYSPYLDDKEIIRLYDRNSPFGVHKESDDELRRKYGAQI